MATNETSDQSAFLAAKETSIQRNLCFVRCILHSARLGPHHTVTATYWALCSLKSTFYRPFPHVNEKACSHTSQMTTILVWRSPVSFDETLSWKGSRSTYSCSDACDGLFDTFYTYISFNILKSMQFSVEATISGSSVVLRWLTSKQGMDALEEFWLERPVGSLNLSWHCHHCKEEYSNVSHLT